MASDRPVSARTILRAEEQLRRVGHCRTMDLLEQDETDLSSHLLEELSQIHRHILALGGPAKPSQRCYRRVQHIALITVLALRPPLSSSEVDPPDAGDD